MGGVENVALGRSAPDRVQVDPFSTSRQIKISSLGKRRWVTLGMFFQLHCLAVGATRDPASTRGVESVDLA